LGDVSLVGGKEASLGELLREFTPLGLRDPNGFAITVEGYRYVLDQAKARAPPRESLAGLDHHVVARLGQ